MGLENFKTKKAIVHMIEWIASIIVAVMLADVICFDCLGHFIKNQFIDAVAYSYLIICSLLFIMLFTDEEFEEKVGHVIRGLGAVLYIAAGILLLMFLENYSDSRGNNDNGRFFRILLGGVFACFNGVVFCIEFFIMLFKKSLLD